MSSEATRPAALEGGFPDAIDGVDTSMSTSPLIRQMLSAYWGTLRCRSTLFMLGTVASDNGLTRAETAAVMALLVEHDHCFPAFDPGQHVGY